MCSLNCVDCICIGTDRVGGIIDEIMFTCMELA